MLELIPDNLRLFVVIGGLLFVLLVVASLSQKYEQYLAAKRLAVQRILIGVHQIEEALEKSRSGGLPQGIGKLLRNELLARYITIRQIYPRHPQINQRIMEAEERLRAETDGVASVNMTAITTGVLLNNYLAGLGEIIALLHGQALGRRLSVEERAAQQTKLLDFQLTASSRFFTKTAVDCARNGDWQSAARNARMLESFLYSKPRHTPLATKLREEARELVRSLNEERLPGEQQAS